MTHTIFIIIVIHNNPMKMTCYCHNSTNNKIEPPKNKKQNVGNGTTWKQWVWDMAPACLLQGHRLYSVKE